MVVQVRQTYVHISAGRTTAPGADEQAGEGTSNASSGQRRLQICEGLASGDGHAAGPKGLQDEG